MEQAIKQAHGILQRMPATPHAITEMARYTWDGINEAYTWLNSVQAPQESPAPATPEYDGFLDAEYTFPKSEDSATRMALISMLSQALKSGQIEYAGDENYRIKKDAPDYIRNAAKRAKAPATPKFRVGDRVLSSAGGIGTVKAYLGNNYVDCTGFLALEIDLKPYTDESASGLTQYEIDIIEANAPDKGR